MNGPARREKKASIEVESLEGRVVLSTVHAMVVPSPGSLVRGSHYLYLQGTAQGVTRSVVGNPDVGTSVRLLGSGQFTGQGRLQVSGTLHGTGFIAGGNPNGTLRLSNNKGSVNLRLQGPPSPGFTAPTSGTYQYTIQTGSGALNHSVGAGTARLVLGSRAFNLTFQGKPNNV